MSFAQLSNYLRCIFFIGIGCFFLSFTSLVPLSWTDLSSTPPPISDPVWAFHEQPVQIRGFWYPLSPQKGILAPQPNVKSCCLMASTKIGEQVLIEGQHIDYPSNQAITLEGLFKIEPRYDEKGHLTQLYRLEQPLLKSADFSWLRLLVVLMGSIGIGFYLFKRQQKRLKSL